MNKYTFRRWHNGAGEWHYYTVEANGMKEAYEKSYKLLNKEVGFNYEVEFVCANVTTYSIVCFDIDYVLDTYDTRTEAETGVQEAIAWDKQHHQGYEPFYEIIENAPREKEVE